MFRETSGSVTLTDASRQSLFSRSVPRWEMFFPSMKSFFMAPIARMKALSDYLRGRLKSPLCLDSSPTVWSETFCTLNRVGTRWL